MHLHNGVIRVDVLGVVLCCGVYACCDAMCLFMVLLAVLVFAALDLVRCLCTAARHLLCVGLMCVAVSCMRGD